MDEISSTIVDTHDADKIFQLFVIATVMMLAWLLEAAWKNDKRWILPILIFPPCVVIFAYKYWEETRARCFFISLLLAVMLIIGGVVGFNLAARVIQMLEVIVLWPYFVVRFVAPHLNLPLNL